MSKFVNLEIPEQTFEKLESKAKLENKKSVTAYIQDIIDKTANKETEKEDTAETIIVKRENAVKVATPIIDCLISEDNYRKMLNALNSKNTGEKTITAVNLTTLKNACIISNRIEMKTLYALYFVDKDNDGYITLTNKNLKTITEITQRTAENLIPRLNRMETNGIIEIDRKNNRLRIKE